MTYGEKKLLYGTANRIAVGGRADEPVADHQKGAMLLIKKYVPDHINQSTPAKFHLTTKASDARTLTWSPSHITLCLAKRSFDSTFDSTWERVT